MELHNYQQVHGLIKGIGFVINSRYNDDDEFKSVSLNRSASHFNNFDIHINEHNILLMSFDTIVTGMSFKWMNDGSVEIKYSRNKTFPLWHVNIKLDDSATVYRYKKTIDKLSDTRYQFSLGSV